MSFVLQLGTVETPDEVGNNNSTSVIAQELTGTIPIGTVIAKPLLPTNNNKSQNLQNLKTVNITSVPPGTTLSSIVKPVTVTYPVNKTIRDAQKIGGSQTKTTQVLTTRVISQKIPSSTYQIHPTNSPVSPAHALHLPVKTPLPSPGTNVTKIQSLPSPTFTQTVNAQSKMTATPEGAQNKQQSATITNLQSTMHQKSQVSTQQILNTSGVKTITTTSVPNMQRIQLKTQNIGGKPQTVNLQKVKTIANVNNQMGHRVNLPRMQTIPKSQVLTPSTQGTQISMSQVMNSANMQRVQQVNSSGMQHVQKVHQPLGISNAQKLSQVFGNQKVQPQVIGNAAGHAMQKVQHSGLQQNQQILQKGNVVTQKTLGVQRQQQSTAVNNLSKSVNSVAGIQKVQPNAQQQQQKNIQTTQQQRPQAMATLQKSQTMATVNSNKTQSASNITKSNSVPNISKLQQNQNSINVSKQQITNQTAQVQTTQLSQLQQQLMHQTPQNQQQQQITQKQQQQQINALSQTQRCQSVTGGQQKMATITSIPSNQRAQTTTNTKAQQQQLQPQMVLRVGPSKNQSQNMQSANMKPVSQKVMNSVKTLNQQNVAQQSNRTLNSQPIKIIQQQQQNLIGPQNTQKQPGCIKTIPPQKSAQRNHVPKVSGIKTSLNTNLSSLKGQGSQTTIAQKTSIKTLLPQQPSGQNMIANKNQPVKIQQQSIQQKQLVMTAQYPQQLRAQTGQIKTLLPVVGGEIRKDNDNKNETEPHSTNEDGGQRAPQSPARRIPLPYEFVLQDHNYGAPPPRTPPPASPPPHPKQQPVNGGGSSTAVPQHPFTYGQAVVSTNVEDDAGSAISSEAGREAEPEGEETETAPEGEGDDEDSVTRCICDFEHDDGYMICCDRCLVWQHVDCMGIDRSNIPDEYLCEMCRPRRVDRQRARTLQLRKREELLNSDTSSDSSSTSSADTDVGVNTAPKKRAPSQPQQQQSQPLQQQQPQQQQQLQQQQQQLQQQQQVQPQVQPQHQQLQQQVQPQQQQPQQQQPQQQQQQQQQQPQQQQTQQATRRKSDPPPQVRRLSSTNNNNNNVAKRQRRDPHPRQTSAVRKKETVKRGPGKRKTKRRMSLEDREEDTQDAWGTNMAPLRQWIERYEEAVTNHYSPELRARISSIKVNGAHGDLRQSNMNAAATGKCRLNVHSNNLRFLVATMYLPPNTPVVELRGKYMLSAQHRPSHPQSRQHAQRPGPFVFFYRLPRDGTEVCVDTRTYGNDARFVRRSCKPNAEVKHCIEKGTLHLYIVTTTAIEKNAEITIRHEQHDLMLSPNLNSPIVPLICACNNTRECQVAAMGQLSRRGSNGALAENADGRERRRRGRRNTVCEDSDSLSAVSSTSISQPAPTPAPAPAVAPTRRTLTSGNASSTVTRQVTAKEETPVVQQPPLTSPSIVPSQPPETTKKDKKKMTREERKMEAIMKAFERLEKAEQRKQEVQARNAQRKESGGTHSDNDDTPITSAQVKQKPQSAERPVRRKRRKGRARTTSTSHSQQNRCRTRLNSADSDISSGEESNSMQSPPLPNQNCPPIRGMPYAQHLHTPTKDVTDSSSVGSTGHHGIPTAAGLLLALANSNVPGPSSPPLQQPTPIKSPTCDSGASSSSQSSTPSTPLSSACLLVAAAVGPLAPGFKFPKTKKVLMNEWLKESPDPPQTHIPQISPIPALPSAPLCNPITQLNKPTDFLSPTDPSPEFLTQSYAAKSLATLVQAANSVSGICDSPPQRRQTIPGNSSCSGSTGSAKKRWLRQAISEECDSPNSRPESPPSEMVAPPKKRRIARESLSSDNYTPPTTPTLLSSEHVLSQSTCNNEDEFVDMAQSPNNEHSTPNSEYVHNNVKDEADSESEAAETIELKEKIKFMNPEYDIPQSELCIKYEKDDEPMPLVKSDSTNSVKLEVDSIKEEKVFVNSPNPRKTEITMVKQELGDTPATTGMVLANKIELPEVKEEAIQENDSHNIKKEASQIKKESQVVLIEKGTVEIVDQNEPDTEMEDLSSPIAAMESDAVLKQRAAEMRLEFSGSIADIVNIASENEKSDDDRKYELNKADELKSDDNMSIDEFDVEAQMMKITGDDGNDYKEKVDTSSEKDKSMDGIEGLMDSSKEDSDSEDNDVDDPQTEKTPFGEFHITTEHRAFREFESKPEDRGFIDFEVKRVPNRVEVEVTKIQPSSEPNISLEESIILESTCSNIDVETIVKIPKIEFPIPPLSERIRKKTEQQQPAKLQLDFEASIIESTIEIEAGAGSTEGEQKSMLSSALRELLEAKIDVDPEPLEIEPSTAKVNVISPDEQLDRIQCTNPVNMQDLVVKSEEQITQVESALARVENIVPTEPRRLKDPRTIAPTDMPAPLPTKPEVPAPVKRKVRTLSISEYRKRKQQSSGTPPEPEPEPSTDATSDRGGTRGRSDSASSGTSSLSSDEEGNSKVSSLDLPGLTTLPLFINVDSDEKKGGEEGVMGWSAAPTLVERQRENLTERLKREFGLFLSDDEEERARKQGLTAEAILKARKLSPSTQAIIPGATTVYPTPQLPPQPYIPPPGSAPIHFPQFQTKPVPVQYSNFAVPQAVSQPIYPNTTAQPLANKQQTQQFLIPQAPPGSNPYPPQFVPSSSAVPAQRFPAVPAPPPQPSAQFFPPSPQVQKTFFNHPAPRT
ncbi:uncharacterized protein LOC105687044 isoform X3 [Athalia rosae]|uniref:uncharacterized protein LOC105687044 isoform X3 n=1 Tax=Athalia rosae TaxID=37344 RepID=UPI00203446E8|nr:uncharacterized protein LOC105687044 isoform X3 [Athalia rosae]